MESQPGLGGRHLALHRDGFVICATAVRAGWFGMVEVHIMPGMRRWIGLERIRRTGASDAANSNYKDQRVE